MTIASILKTKGRAVATVRPSMTLQKAAELLDQKMIGAVVVVDERGRVEGILSERDIVRTLARTGASALAATAGEAMSKPVVPCRESDTVDAAMSIMTVRRFRHLPVVEGGELVGIVSIGDVVKHKIAEAEMETEAMRNYIATA